MSKSNYIPDAFYFYSRVSLLIFWISSCTEVNRVKYIQDIRDLEKYLPGNSNFNLDMSTRDKIVIDNNDEYIHIILTPSFCASGIHVSILDNDTEDYQHIEILYVDELVYDIREW